MAADLQNAEFIIDPETGDIIGIRASGVTGYFSNTPNGGGAITITAAAFSALVAASGLTAGTEYYVSDLPARWIATGPNTYDGLGFVQSGVTYFGDEAVAAQTEIDLAAGTWATRPLTGFDAGVVYYRRMTDIGTLPGGCVMSWLGGTSVEWRVTQSTWAVWDHTTVTGAQNTSPQALNPKDIPAGLLLACNSFRIHVTAAKSGNTDAMTSFAPKLGTAGTTADTSLLGPPSSAIAGSDRSRNGVHRYRWYDATHIRVCGAPTANGTDASTSTNGAPDTEYAIDCSVALKLSLGVTMTAATVDSPRCAFIGLLLEP